MTLLPFIWFPYPYPLCMQCRCPSSYLGSILISHIQLSRDESRWTLLEPRYDFWGRSNLSLILVFFGLPQHCERMKNVLVSGKKNTLLNPFDLKQKLKIIHTLLLNYFISSLCINVGVLVFLNCYYLWEFHLLGGSMPNFINKNSFKSIYFWRNTNVGFFSMIFLIS